MCIKDPRAKTPNNYAFILYSLEMWRAVWSLKCASF